MSQLNTLQKMGLGIAEFHALYAIYCHTCKDNQRDQEVRGRHPSITSSVIYLDSMVVFCRGGSDVVFTLEGWL